MYIKNRESLGADPEEGGDGSPPQYVSEDWKKTERRVWVENGYAWILVDIEGHVKQGTLQNPRITWNSDEKLAPPRNLSVLDLLFAAQFQSRGIAVISEVGEGGQEITMGYEMDAKGNRGRIGKDKRRATGEQTGDEV